MAWRDKLQQGSFRGASFEVKESRAQFGRRNETFEYPNRDTPYTEDLGRSARRWSMEVFVLGPDYMTARDALIDAIQAKGAGTLVHPYLGSVRANAVWPCEVIESTDEGGMARFSLQFVEAGDDLNPSSGIDTVAATLAASSAVDDAITAQVVPEITIAPNPQTLLASALGTLKEARASLNTALQSVAAVGHTLWTVQGQIDALVGSAEDLLSAPGELIGQVQSILSGLGDLAGFPEDLIAALATLMGFGSIPSGPANTPTEMQAAANQTAIVLAIRAAAASGAARAVAGLEFTSYDDAAAWRATVSDALDAVADAAGDAGLPDLRQALATLRLAVIQDVTARGGSLARLYAYTPAMTEPALVIAQRLYGDASRAAEIVARNAIPHPLFVPGGQALEVLGNV